MLQKSHAYGFIKHNILYNVQFQNTTNTKNIINNRKFPEHDNTNKKGDMVNYVSTDFIVLYNVAGSDVTWFFL